MRRRALERQRKELYAQVFQGPTPEFPEEDAAEATFAAAASASSAADGKRNTAQRVVEQVTHAQNQVQELLAELLCAHAASIVDVSGGGLRAGHDKLDALKRAAAALERMQAYTAGAVTMCAALASYPVPSVTIPKRTSYGLDVVLDTNLIDGPLHNKILQAKHEAQAAAAAIAQMHCHATGEAAAAVALAVMKRATLHEARAALSAIRDSIFERVIAEG